MSDTWASRIAAARAALDQMMARQHVAPDTVADLNEFFSQVEELAADAEEDDMLRDRMAALLTGVANGLKGPPKPLSLHDWSDLPAKAAEVVAKQRGIYEAASGFAVWWAMVEAHEELAGEPPIPDSAAVLHFMGSGASTMVTAREIRGMLAAIYDVKP